MQMRKASCGVLVFLLCALVIGASEAVRKTKLSFPGGGDRIPHREEDEEIDEYMAEQVWYHCRKELIGGINGVEDLDLYDPQEAASESEAVYTSQGDVHKAILDLPPHVKQTLVNCLRENGVVFRASDNRISPKKWVIGCSEWLFGTEISSRRFLAADSAEEKSASAATKKAQAVKHSHLKHKKKAKDKKNSSKSDIILLSVASAAASVVILCCCCVKRKQTNQVFPGGVLPKDDRPLLHMSSAGSSQVFSNLGSSRDFSVSGKFGNAATNNGNQSSDGMPGGTGGPPKILLPPPPGKSFPPSPPGKSFPPSPQGPQGPQGPQAPPAPPAPQAPPAPPHPGLKPPPPPGPHAPPPPKGAPRPPGKAPIPPLGNRKAKDANSADVGSGSGKTKLKPLFWDKVNATTDNPMVWNEVTAGSFQFNEKKIAELFGTAPTPPDRRNKSSSMENVPQYVTIIEKKKAQNLMILLKGSNVTTQEVADAIQEGNELPLDLLQALLKMSPTSEEELKLRMYSADITLLGPAERFLKVLIDIPFAIQRIEALLFMCSFREEVSNTKESFATLEVASNKVRKSRLFLRLLEAVLKMGNRMNDGTYRGGAIAFRLDTLLKTADVKGTDGKTTLLHFVVQEIIRYESKKAARNARESGLAEESAQYYRNLGLHHVSGLSDELHDVVKAAGIDADGLTLTVTRLGRDLIKTRTFVETELKQNLDEDNQFRRVLTSFLERAQGDVTFLLEEEKRVTILVKETADYFHGNAMKNEGIRLFSIVTTFLKILNSVCHDIQTQEKNKEKERKTDSRTKPPPKKEAIPEASSVDQSQPQKEEASLEKKENAPLESSSETKENAPLESSSEKKEDAPPAEANSEKKKEKALVEQTSDKIYKVPMKVGSDKKIEALLEEECLERLPDSRKSSFDFGQRLFPAIAGLRIQDDFSSDDEA